MGIWITNIWKGKHLINELSLVCYSYALFVSLLFKPWRENQTKILLFKPSVKHPLTWITKFVCNFGHGLNNEPFDKQTILDHLNIELVGYSDPHCTRFSSVYRPSILCIDVKSYHTKVTTWITIPLCALFRQPLNCRVLGAGVHVGFLYGLGKIWDPGLILPTKILRSKFFFQINLKILNPQIFLEKSEKIRSDFLVQLAGQISENKIQEFLIG